MFPQSTVTDVMIWPRVRLGAIVLAASPCFACSDGGAATGDAGTDLGDATRRDGGGHPLDGTSDAAIDRPTMREAAPDGPPPTAVLLRLANWSPDAPGVDFCLAPHESSNWNGPLLAMQLPDAGLLGNITVVDAAIPIDAGSHVLPPPDAGLAGDAAADAADDAVAEASPSSDARAEAAPTDGSGPTVQAGLEFARISPYIQITPGQFDLRVVKAGALDCAASLPQFPDATNLPPFIAGSTMTVAMVGELSAQGSDPGASVVSFSDDTALPGSTVRLRFVNAVPSVTETSLETGTLQPMFGVLFTSFLASAQFGGIAADTNDGGAVDTNDYLTLAPIDGAYWAVLNANGGVAPLVAVDDVSIAAGRLATVVAVGGVSGPKEADVGILVCTDQPPIVRGETASCELYEGSGLTAPVCASCP